MNNFDRYIYKLLQELNLETGNSNQTGDDALNVRQHTSNTKTGFGMGSIIPNKTLSTNNNSNNSNNSNNGKGMNTLNIPEDKLDEMLYDPKTNFNDLLKDENNKNTVLGYILGKSEDVTYKNKDKLTSLMTTNKDLQTAVNNFTANSKK